MIIVLKLQYLIDNNKNMKKYTIEEIIQFAKDMEDFKKIDYKEGIKYTHVEITLEGMSNFYTEYLEGYRWHIFPKLGYKIQLVIFLDK